MIQLIYLVNQLNQAISAKKLYTRIQFSKIGNSLLNLLYKEGLISSYSIHGNGDPRYSYFVILLKFDNNLPVIRSIKICSSSSKYTTIKYFKLRQLSSINPTAIYILSSSSLGICTSHQALRYKQGGLLLFEIY